MAEPRGRNYTRGERAIMVLGVNTGQSCVEINRVVEPDAVKGGRKYREMPETTYADLTSGIFVRFMPPTLRISWSKFANHTRGRMPVFGSLPPQRHRRKNG